MSEPDGRRVGFLIAGVQKGGTTTLYAALRRHRQIAQAKPKELHYFDDDRHDWSAPDYGAYEGRFAAPAAARIAGEATPSYVFWPRAIDRIRSYNPQMRLILSFRDPVERAFSQWCMNRSDHPDGTPEFSSAIRQFAPPALPSTPAEAGGRRRSYVVRGYYGAQLKQVLDAFPDDQLLLLDFHRTFRAWNDTVDRVTDFLELDRFGRRREQKHRRALPSGLTGAPPTADDIEFLVDRYAEDLATFSALSGLDVSEWPTSAVVRSEVTPAAFADRLAVRAGLTAS